MNVIHHLYVTVTVTYVTDQDPSPFWHVYVMPMVFCSRPIVHLSFPTTYLTMSEIVYRQYVGESDLPHIMALVQSELSEPYVIYTFRYFLHQWFVKLPHSCGL